MTDDATDRLIDALGSRHLERDVRLFNAVDRSVRQFQRQKAGLEPWTALEALKAAQDAWERRRSTEAPKAA